MNVSSGLVSRLSKKLQISKNSEKAKVSCLIKAVNSITDDNLNGIKYQFDELGNTEKSIFIEYLMVNVSGNELSDSTCLKTQLLNLVKPRLFTNQKVDDEKYDEKIVPKTSDEINEEGKCYLKGKGAEKNPNKAFLLFEQAAKRNHPDATYNLGVCYELGLGVKQSPEKAVELYEKAAKLNHSGAMNDLGTCCEYGWCGVEMDLKEAVKWYEKAAKLNDSGAALNLGICYELSHEINEEGERYFQGEWGEENRNKAFLLFKQAADLNHPKATYNLGLCYDQGLGVEVDLKEAVKWYEQAADLNHSDAMNDLGICYEQGLGVEAVDLKEAVKWYQKAADLNHPKATYNLGLCYFDGLGVDRNYKTAFKYVQLAYYLHKIDEEKPDEITNIIQKTTDDLLNYFKGSAEESMLSLIQECSVKYGDQNDLQKSHTACFISFDDLEADDQVLVLLNPVTKKPLNVCKEESLSTWLLSDIRDPVTRKTPLFRPKMTDAEEEKKEV